MKGRYIALGTLLALLTTSSLGTSFSSALTVPFPGARPFTVVVPTTYQPSEPAPLIIALSGYNQTGAQLEKYLHLATFTQSQGILYVYPDGTKDRRGIRFWNGTPECCDFESPKVDDAGYVMSIIDQISTQYSVDSNRIYIFGHSNGGFLANSLACLHADRIAAVASLAGASYTKIAACKPSSPVSVLQIWGTADETFVGNHIRGRPIPGALATFHNWGVIDGCPSAAVTFQNKMDLDAKIPGLESTVTEYQGCPAKSAITFWKIAGGGHDPVITKTFDQALIDFFLAHPKVPSN